MKNISVLIVGYNESHLLKKSLPALRDFGELIYVDLQSKDDSVAVAKQYASKVICHEKVPVVEIIHANLIKDCTYDWVLLTDPDEIIDESLKSELIKIVDSNFKDVGIVRAPIQFYFKKYPLKGTIWGGKNSRVILVHKDRIEFSAHVHRGRQIKPNYKTIEIERQKSNIIHHYWMHSYGQLFKKHTRYIKQEGKSMFEHGIRIHFIQIIKVPFTAFKECFITKKGYKDGLIGLSLSLFWCWYKTNTYLCLFKYQRTLQK